MAVLGWQGLDGQIKWANFLSLGGGYCKASKFCLCRAKVDATLEKGIVCEKAFELAVITSCHLSVGMFFEAQTIGWVWKLKIKSGYLDVAKECATTQIKILLRVLEFFGRPMAVLGKRQSTRKLNFKPFTLKRADCGLFFIFQK